MNIASLCVTTAKVCGVSAKPGKDTSEALETRAHRRMRGFLKRKFPHATAENVAVVLRVSVRQAYDLLSGKARWTWRHILRLIDHFKGDFMHSVLHPLTGEDGRPRFRLRMPKRRKAVSP